MFKILNPPEHIRIRRLLIKEYEEIRDTDTERARELYQILFGDSDLTTRERKH